MTTPSTSLPPPTTIIKTIMILRYLENNETIHVLTFDARLKYTYVNNSRTYIFLHTVTNKLDIKSMTTMIVY